MIPYEHRVMHVRFEGRSYSIRLSELEIREWSRDEEVRQALAFYLDMPLYKLDRYVIERHANGNITVRPEAVFG
jgi:hypothetical protein